MIYLKTMNKTDKDFNCETKKEEDIKKVLNENKERIIIDIENSYFHITSKYNCFQRDKQQIKELIGAGLFLITYIFYFLSLEKCKKGQEDCSIKYQWQIKKVIEEIISCFLAVIAFELIFFKVISKKHLIHFFILFLCFYLYSHGIDFFDHGFYNFVYFFVIIILIIIIFLPFNVFVYLIRNKPKIYIYIYVIIILVIIGFIFYIILINSNMTCYNWGIGLNNTSIINDNLKYGCQIKYPKQCIFNNRMIYYLQDQTNLLKKKCSKYIRPKSRYNLIKYSKSPFINSSTYHFGYPLSNKDLISIKEPFRETLEKNFINNLVDMENKEILNEFLKKKIPEVSVDFTNNIQGKIKINIEFNQTLSNQRKIFEKNCEPYSNNVLILYIDSVSRQNAIRELQKTLSFFENFMKYKDGFNDKKPTEYYHSFEFFKYHSFIGYTSKNFPFLFYGESRFTKNKTLINKYFKENGYITSLAHDACLRDNTKCEHEFTEEEVYDYEFNLCDPNKEHININTIRCLYGKQDLEHLLDYTDIFWRKYPLNRKFSLLISNYGHEGTLRILKYADEPIYKFLKSLFIDNLLKDTSIILMSDHGQHMPSFYYLLDFYKIEKQLPMLYIIVNDRKKINYAEQYKFIHENQQAFITAFDFHNTLCNLIYGDKYNEINITTKYKNTCKSSYGESLFNKINGKERSPNLYNNISKMELYVCN